MINYENYVTIGAKLCFQNIDDPAVAFTMNWLGNRTAVAQKVLDRHADFASMYEKIRSNDELVAGGGNANFVEEFDELFSFLNHSQYAEDIYYTILLAAQGAFLERGNEDRENARNLVQIVNNINEDATGFHAIAMLTTAMWFSDYKGYQNAVLRKIGELRAEGYFEEKKRIRINDVFWMQIQNTEGNKKILFICDEIIGMEQFNSDTDGTSYVNSPLRKLMNDESNPNSYINTLFNNAEEIRKRVLPISINDASTGGAIEDKLFLLSNEEAARIDTDLRSASYYNLPEKRYWYMSSVDFSPYDWWWLRSPANDGDPSYVVCNGNMVIDTGASPTCYYGVRPAFWVDNSDGFFDNMYVSVEEYERGRDTKREAYSKQVAYYGEILNQLNSSFINLSTKIKDLPALAEQNKNSPQLQSASSNRSNSGGGCYIATAVYGSYNCPEVWTLRRYRDNYLAHTWYGRLFICLYYAISPILVRLFGETGWFQRFWKRKLDRIVELLQQKGYSSKPYKDE